MLVGIVGKPSCGKSTFFKAATLAEVEIAAYPFTTIKANEGMAFVRVDCVDKDFNVQCNPRQGFCIDGQRFVPVKLLDVAGLVPGAHAGKGRGNAFLDDLRQADALIHVVDASGSTNAEGEAVPAGSYDPRNDVRFLEEELDLWFMDMLKKTWSKFSKQVLLTHAKEQDVAIADQFSGLKINLAMVKKAMQKLDLSGKPLTNWTDDDLRKFASELRLVSKPIIIAANKSDLPPSKQNIENLKKEFPDYMIVPCSAESELALREAAKKDLVKYIPGDSDFDVIKPDSLTEEQKKALTFVKEKILKVWNSTGVQQCLNSAVFDLLKYIVIFPGGVNKLADAKGNVLPDAFLMPPNSTALDFAYRLHSDFGDNFIRAIHVKTKKTVGKDYKLANRDVIEIISKK